MTRTDFQELSELRLKEAEALLAAGCWDGAYYLAGYAVEGGLKACIAKLTKAEEFPPDRDRIAKIYSHKIEELMNAAGLKKMRNADASADPTFEHYWSVAIGWSEQSRYGRVTESDARRLHTAIADTTSGVLQWIRKYW